MATLPGVFDDICDTAPLTALHFAETMAALLQHTHALASVCHEASQGENPTWENLRDALGILEDYTASAQAFFARWQAERAPGSTSD